MALTVILADGTLIVADAAAAAAGTTAAASPGADTTHAATDAAKTTATTEAAPDAHGGKKVFPPLDATTFAPQLIWFALTFGAMYWLLSRIALPRVSSVLDARAAHIKRDLNEAERLKGETDKALAEYERALADAKNKANGIAQQTRDTLKTYVDQQRTKADKENADKMLAAEAQIQSSKQSAMANVGAIAAETAEAILGRLVTVPVSRDDIAAALRNLARS